MEFGVHGRFVEAAGIRVIGRCFSGPLRVGEVFHRMRRYLDGPGPMELDVTLTIVGIEAYGRPLDALDKGVTGSLSLRGAAPDALGDGWALIG